VQETSFTMILWWIVDASLCVLPRTTRSKARATWASGIRALCKSRCRAAVWKPLAAAWPTQATSGK
jgi:hypothetical protein